MVWDSWLELNRPMSLTEVKRLTEDKRIGNCIAAAVSCLSVVTNYLAEAAYGEKAWFGFSRL